MIKLPKQAIACALLAAFLASPLPALAWSSRVDCEGGAANTLPANKTGPGAIFWGNNTRYSTEQVGTGKQSCKFSIKAGSEGWPSSGGPLEWGSIFSLPASLKVGEELWVRVSVFLPNDFQIVTNTGQLKFIRLHTKTVTTNTGCLDLLMGVKNTPLWDTLLKRDTYPPYIASFEGRPGLTMVGSRPIDDPALGRWETYEIYVKLDSVSVNNGGMGVMRVWKNNRLIINATNQVAAADKSGIVDSVYLFTYWNGTAPADQYAYMDDMILTNERPANRDANGYAFIGAPAIGGKIPGTPSSVLVN